YKQHYHP
uniref:Uncharacterized protein n=1 Tax=Solanum lycopersicum TaxID=4081 RepID=A0A3Q7HNG5_SOLLC